MSARDPSGRPIEDAVAEAIARGDFDDLPGAGKPLDLPSRHDPDWWIKQRLEDDDIDRDALLPVVVLLRREHATIGDTLDVLTSEEQVREHLEDFNRRVQDDRLRHPMARMLAPTVDVEARIARWRAARAERDAAAAGTTSPAPEPEPRRPWWGRLLGR